LEVGGKICEKFIHQALKYSGTVWTDGEMHHQILKIQ